MMKSNLKLALALAVGAVMGGTAIQALHAQTKTPVYLVTEIAVSNPDAYRKEYVPKAQAAVKAAGIREVALGGRGGPGPQVTAVEGEPPPRVVIQVFDSLEHVKAFRSSAEYKASRAVGDKYGTFRSYAVDALKH
jgi:uncharacterized protein (DUF1330 family)